MDSTLEIVKQLSGPGSTIVMVVLAALYFKRQTEIWMARYDKLDLECHARHDRVTAEYLAKLTERDAANRAVIEQCGTSLDRMLAHLGESAAWRADSHR